jgi:hypothetical protein
MQVVTKQKNGVLVAVRIRGRIRTYANGSESGSGRLKTFPEHCAD